MSLKRKRSTPELSSSPRSDTTTTPPAGSSLSPVSFSPLPYAPFTRSIAPSHLPSRTLKRFRGSRPPDQEVHQHTLDLLYAGPQQERTPPQRAESLSLRAPPTQALTSPTSQNRTQSSLHRFWNLPSAPSVTLPLPSVECAVSAPANCEDCGNGLVGDGDSMDLDGDALGSGHACGACGKSVCFHCSITNLGEQRRCLHCVDGRRWRADIARKGMQGVAFW